VKAIRFLPLAYLADVHGFVLFAPYLLLVVAAALLAHQWAKRRARLALPAPAALGPFGHLSEPIDSCDLDAALVPVG
jgi:hypothetical protein